MEASLIFHINFRKCYVEYPIFHYKTINISFLPYLPYGMSSNLANICSQCPYIFRLNVKVKGQSLRSQLEFILCLHQFFCFISHTTSWNPIKLSIHLQLVCIHIQIKCRGQRSKSKVKAQVYILFTPVFLLYPTHYFMESHQTQHTFVISVHTYLA